MEFDKWPVWSKHVGQHDKHVNLGQWCEKVTINSVKGLVCGIRSEINPDTLC
jgi:hypothetical protein